ncbi:Qat anti-phage system ATPase QatA [Leptospira noguchii]|uniref:KAP family P-loop domain protein n=1 Tax=Leptospira noguchii TaxID=28182 RepID=M6VJE3_9LEPT|nr:Qat anti-phage system ATPase QatA [Leptospira noguchii]EMO55151.1 KAP family P-loop domain protein [Leptospira noguchii]
MILSDNETDIDLLNNEAIAKTIIDLINERAEQPITIGIHGDWGAGKSSILEMIDLSLKETKDVICIKFNGWRFQGFEDAKIALIEGIVSDLIEKRSLITKASGLVKEIFQRIDWLKLAKKAGGLAFSAYTGLPSIEQINSIVKTMQSLADSSPEKISDQDTLKHLNEEFSNIKLTSSVGSKNLIKEFSEFQTKFDELLDAAEVKKLVVLIDDLDRCLPETAIEILEAIRLFLFTRKTAFIVAADEAMIEYAVRKHFPDLPESSTSQTYARKYLEKLIQIPFRIPALGEPETRTYVKLLLIGAEIGDGSTEFKTLVKYARAKLIRPWIAGSLETTEIQQILKDKYSKVQSALFLSDQIGPILSSGAKGNPRQIKRFLNTLILRNKTANARGFATDIEMSILAKLMLAERFIPNFFDQIANLAASSAQGKCIELNYLEAYVSMPSEKSKPKKKDTTDSSANKKVKEQDSQQLLEWKNSVTVCEWAKVQPLIGDKDLRPYLFIAKDRKDYFGTNSALGHLIGLAEKLLESKFTIQSFKLKLNELNPNEASEVFELLITRIVGSNKLQTTPKGAEGLEILVKSHPQLQSRLLDFLASLSVDTLGPWACSGWSEAIVDQVQFDRFKALLDHWSKSGSALLKTTAKTTLATYRTGD